MDTQGQQHPMFQLPQEELQQIIALVLRVVAQLDDRALSQLRENQQFVDELAQAVAEAMTEEKDKAAQPFIPPEPEWTVEERGIEDLIDEEELERMDENGLSFGRSYTRVNRNGEQVLYLLSEYYDESVLEAAKEDDLQPPPRERMSVSTLIGVGNQHVAMVEGGSSITPKTLVVIKVRLPQSCGISPCVSLHRGIESAAVSPSKTQFQNGNYCSLRSGPLVRRPICRWVPNR